MSERIGMVSLGCAKNQVNAEQMLFLLQQAGFEVTGDPDGCDLAVVNTCGFIDSAKQEAIDNILALGQLKEAGRLGKILVTGCLAQRYQEEIIREMPEVDGILGTGSYYDIVAAVKKVLAGRQVLQFDDIDAPIDETDRILTTPEHYAYLKIAEGCDNHCSYCIIPQLRGRYRSRELDDVLYEARRLAQDGVKEIIVVAQDITRYGIDLDDHELLLPKLLRELCKIDGIHWVRLHYLYPEVLTDEMIDVIAEEPKIVKYIDLPIQHINNEILRKMNRRGDKEFLEGMFRKLRERIPGVVLRTSLIAGLPGEGEEEFEELCQFLREFKLERVGAFVFSPEEGTLAATMEYPPHEVAVQRAERLTEIQSRIMDEYNETLMGATMEVLCEGYDPDEDAYFGRSYGDSPDIDGKVWFASEETVKVGQFVNVVITDVYDGELIGEVEEEA